MLDISSRFLVSSAFDIVIGLYSVDLSSFSKNSWLSLFILLLSHCVLILSLKWDVLILPVGEQYVCIHRSHNDHQQVGYGLRVLGKFVDIMYHDL